jgi:uncharacterized protein
MSGREFYHDGMLALKKAAGFFFIASSYRNQPDCSFKAGDPGFVRITGPSTLEFSDYDGNLMFRTLGNIAMHPNVGLLIISFGAAPIPRYIPDPKASAPSPYVPRPGHTPPIPEWKAYPFVTPLLPDADPHKRVDKAAQSAAT